MLVDKLVGLGQVGVKAPEILAVKSFTEPYKYDPHGSSGVEALPTGQSSHCITLILVWPFMANNGTVNVKEEIAFAGPGVPSHVPITSDASKVLSSSQSIQTDP